MAWDLFGQPKEEQIDWERENERFWKNIVDAQFSAIKAHLAAYDRATDRPTILRLLHHGEFVRLTEQAADQCAGLLIAYVERALDSPEARGVPAVRELRPDAKDRAAIKDILLASLDLLAQAIEPYVASYQAFAAVAARGDGVWSDALLWGGEAGDLGGSLFGPMGQIVGSALGGFLAGRRHNAALAEVGSRFDADFLALRQAYDRSMEAMRERVAAVLASIGEKMDAAIAASGNGLARQQGKSA